MQQFEIPPISVLMSVYKKENPEYLDLAVRSMLNQTVQPSEIVIVEDGPLTAGLYAALNKLQEEYPQTIKRFPTETNQGLGLALKYGIGKCQHEFIARMDSDDISHPQRLQIQIQCFINHPRLDLLGSYIKEFDDNPDITVSRRTVPLSHRRICKYQKLRSALNHVTVMFRKSAVLRAGNYEDAPLMEDDILWLNMLDTGSIAANIPMYLVNVRVGAGMYDRRGGKQYLNNYNKARRMALNRGQISYHQYLLTYAVQWLVASVPGTVRKYIFESLLHR